MYVRMSVLDSPKKCTYVLATKYVQLCYGLHHRSYVCTPWPGTKDSVFLSYTRITATIYVNSSCSKRRAHTKKTLQINALEAFQGKLHSACMYVCMYAGSMASRLVMPHLFTLVLWRNRKLGRHRRSAHIWCDGMQWTEKGKDTYVCMHVCMYACMYVCMFVWM